MVNVVSISGTNRPNNYTSRALAIVNDELRQHDIEPVTRDARNLNLAFPGHQDTSDAQELRSLLTEATAVVIASPEYHGSICAMTKLIVENLGFPSALAGKPVALVGVAAGQIGAIKSLEQLKGMVSHVGAIVVPGSVSIAGVQSVFAADGTCTNAGAEQALRGAAQALVEFVKHFICPRFVLEAAVRGDGRPWTATI